MNPKTPLPWNELPCFFDNQCQAFDPQDADYIIQACNSYPKLVQIIDELSDALQEWAEPPNHQTDLALVRRAREATR
jgi:hypothetical protein